MADPEHLSAEQREYIDSMGAYFEHYGVAPLVGRLMGLLILADRPLTLDDMAHALHVSRASISTNIRIGLQSSYAVRVKVPGDRRDYYRFDDNTWERRTLQTAEAGRAAQALAEHGLTMLGPADVRARERLEEMRAYSEFAIEEAYNMQARWRERRRALRATFAARRAAQKPHAPSPHIAITDARSDARSNTRSDAGAGDESVTVERDR